MFDRMELIRASVLWFILSVGYVPIFGSMASLGEKLGRASVSGSTTVTDGKTKLAENYTTQLQNETESSKDSQSQNQPAQQSSEGESLSFWDIVRGGWNTLVLSVSGAGWGFASVVVRAIVLMFAIILAKIFYVIGPVVIAFSILPVFKDKFSQWAGVFTNCLCVPFTMNLLDTIIFSVVGQAWTSDSYASPYSITIFGVCITICYALSFWITSFYCGSSGAAKIMSTAVTMATSAVGYAMSSAAAAPRGTGEPIPATPNIIEDNNHQQPTK
ncbi:MAG TPA: type IV secretion system protein [Chryseosolibacter sp.]